MSTLQEIHRYAVRIIVVAYASVSLAGLAWFIIDKSDSVTEPVGEAPPKNLEKDINLAHFRNGSWIEASSYAWLYIHHPLFAVDGLPRPPSDKEEWVPDRRTDKKPHITVNLARKADISRVAVYHDGRYYERFYTVSCLKDGRPLKTVEAVQSNEIKVEFSLECKQADAVRIDFKWDPYTPHGHIRIYEIEVWGR